MEICGKKKREHYAYRVAYSPAKVNFAFPRAVEQGAESVINCVKHGKLGNYRAGKNHADFANVIYCVFAVALFNVACVKEIKRSERYGKQQPQHKCYYVVISAENAV